MVLKRPVAFPGIRKAAVRSIVYRIAIAVIVLLWASCSTQPKEPEAITAKKTQADGLMEQGHERVDDLALDAARSSYMAALDVYAFLDHREGTIAALLALGRVTRMTGDTETTEEYFNHAESLARSFGEARPIRDVLNHKADLELRRGDPEAAVAYLEDGLPMVEDGRERAAQLRLRGASRFALGSEDEAVSLLQLAAFTAEEAGEHVEAAQSYYKLASIASLGGRYDEARNWAELALAADKAAEYGPGIAADLRALGIIAAKAGDEAAAEDYARRSWLAWKGLGRPDDAAAAKEKLEDILGRPVTVP